LPKRRQPNLRRCPLTPLEWRLRELADGAGYRGGFVILLNGAVYAAAWRRWRR
jgi:hypothetical protein